MKNLWTVFSFVINICFVIILFRNSYQMDKLQKSIRIQEDLMRIHIARVEKAVCIPDSSNIIEYRLIVINRDLPSIRVKK